MDRLKDIGFQKAGSWILQNGKLVYSLVQFGGSSNILYAFVSDNIVYYVGKTTQTLSKRMYGYQNPGKNQSTNIKNNTNIINLLHLGKTVEVFALPDSGLNKIGSFHLNQAAGLEDSIISEINPPWNGTRPKQNPNLLKPNKSLKLTKKSFPKEARLSKQDSNASVTFKVKIGQAYYTNGFFNVRVAKMDAFGPDNTSLNIQLGHNGPTIEGHINRRANGNNTPRVMCGVDYTNWIQKKFKKGDIFLVEVFSPTNIRLS